MEKRRLGKGLLEVSAIGFGCAGFSETHGRYDTTEVVSAVHRALELEINFFDTSDRYGGGASEELLGQALVDRRHKAVIATKFGFIPGEDHKFTTLNGGREHAKQACDASLKRLRTDYIDLYYLHRVDPNTPIEESVGAMAELVKAGKVRFIGVCEASAKTLLRANAIHPLTALQTEYSLWTRDVETEILPACREMGIGFVAYSPLGRGFLTGQIKNETDISTDDFRRVYPRFQAGNVQKNIKVVKILEDIAKNYSCTVAQLVLAWLLKQGKDVVPIPGVRRPTHLEDNARATEVKISNTDMKKLNTFASKVAGNRYNEAMMKKVNA